MDVYKADKGKPRPTLVPVSLIKAVTARHWLAYLEDPASVDKESSLPHLWHLACNIAFLIELADKEKEGC